MLSNVNTFSRLSVDFEKKVCHHKIVSLILLLPKSSIAEETLTFGVRILPRIKGINTRGINKSHPKRDASDWIKGANSSMSADKTVKSLEESSNG